MAPNRNKYHFYIPKPKTSQLWCPKRIIILFCVPLQTLFLILWCYDEKLLHFDSMIWWCSFYFKMQQQLCVSTARGPWGVSPLQSAVIRSEALCGLEWIVVSHYYNVLITKLLYEMMDLFSQICIYHMPNHILNIVLYMYWSVYDFLLHVSVHAATQVQMGKHSKARSLQSGKLTACTNQWYEKREMLQKVWLDRFPFKPWLLYHEYASWHQNSAGCSFRSVSTFNQNKRLMSGTVS